MSEKILASDVMMSNGTWQTGLNNNDLIIGTSGCGKTRGYVKPNVLRCIESMIAYVLEYLPKDEHPKPSMPCETAPTKAPAVG